MRKINIHGDNIVECERGFNLCIKALKLKGIRLNKESSVCCPSYFASAESNDYLFTFYPGYGRWNVDILKLIQSAEGSLREAPDVLFTEVKEGSEIPILSIEYCGALPAGNQAWQRSGRGYSLGKSNIPYLYIAELGGYELDQNRNRKASRLPNPAIPFSYITYSKEHSPVLQIYEKSPGCDSKSYNLYKNVFTDSLLVTLTEKIFLGKDYMTEIRLVEEKLFEFIKIKAAESKGTVTLKTTQWENAYKAINNGKSLIDYLVEDCRVEWKKTAYIAGLTKSAKKFMQIASKYAIGLTSSKLPLCIIPKSNKKGFCSELENLYNNLSDDFKIWISSSEDLVIVWIMGFKPKGYDARPDRGLAPLARMLAGEKAKILTFVYGPAPIETWKSMEKNPVRLGYTNGLWEAIFSASDALLIDSATSNLKKNCFLKKEFTPKYNTDNLLKNVADTSSNFDKLLVKNEPKKIGENDVDTIIHTLFTHIDSVNVFEGLCNPPGGDWSGISIFKPETNMEYRWLSLPRVSQSNAKRPDHVFIIFVPNQKPIILSIESKERASDLENNIGPDLNRYLTDLFLTETNAQRKLPEQEWSYSEIVLNSKEYQFASAAAYVMKQASDLLLVKAKVNTDLIFSFIFNANNKCQLKIDAPTQIGKIIAQLLEKNSPIEDNLSINN